MTSYNAENLKVLQILAGAVGLQLLNPSTGRILDAALSDNVVLTSDLTGGTWIGDINLNNYQLNNASVIISNNDVISNLYSLNTAYSDISNLNSEVGTNSGDLSYLFSNLNTVAFDPDLSSDGSGNLSVGGDIYVGIINGLSEFHTAFVSMTTIEGGLQFSGGSLNMYSDIDSAIATTLNGDGSGSFAQNLITWDTGGHLSVASFQINGGEGTPAEIYNDGTAQFSHGAVTINSSGDINANGNLNAVGNFATDNGAITSDGSGNLTVGGDFNVTGINLAGAPTAITYGIGFQFGAEDINTTGNISANDFSGNGFFNLIEATTINLYSGPDPGIGLNSDGSALFATGGATIDNIGNITAVTVTAGDVDFQNINALSIGGTGFLLASDGSGNIGSVTFDASGNVNATSVIGQSIDTPGANINSDGSGSFALGNIQWDTAGNIDTVADFTLAGGSGGSLSGAINGIWGMNVTSTSLTATHYADVVIQGVAYKMLLKI